MSYTRSVRLEEVDTAQIVFFARYFSYAHEALEDLFSALEGGYPALTITRKICFATVKIEAEFLAPLRYGDAVTIGVVVTRLGKRSATLRYELVRGDRITCARIVHTIVCTDMKTLTSCEMPADVRALLGAAREA